MNAPSAASKKQKINYKPYAIRLAIVLVLSAVLAGGFNELTYSMQKDEYDRAPRNIRLVIPQGTADRIEAGVEPGFPASMIFVVGDVLEVKNEDLVAHQIGPVFVPPGTTGTLAMNQVDSLSYDCSFRSNRYLGIEIRPATTWLTRIQAMLLAAPTTGILLFLYSLLVWPIREKQETPAPPDGDSVS